MEGRRGACAENAARGVSRYPFTVQRVGATAVAFSISGQTSFSQEPVV